MRGEEGVDLGGGSGLLRIANHLLWNGDVGLARAVFAEVDPIDHPVSNFGVRIVRARIARGEGDDAAAHAILDTVVPEECHDPLGIAERCWRSSRPTWRSRTTAWPRPRSSFAVRCCGTRMELEAHALVDQRSGDGPLQARPRDRRCRRMAQAELGRWPETKHEAAIGLPTAAGGAWPPVSGR
ncbi:MAG: hypothetical protein R2710_26665 [Acidimicrobiales bacterium]